MTILRAQLVMKHASGLAEHHSTNTLYFTTEDGVPDTEPPLIAAAIEAMITSGIGPGGVNFASFMNTEVAQNGHEIKLYDMADSLPRVPVYETSFNLLAAPNGDPLPGEVALCLSFQGEPVSGLTQARRRGRIYLGRLDKDSSTAGRPSASLISMAVAMGQYLLDQSEAAASWSWCVFSAAHEPTVKDPRPAYPETFAIVKNGWVDNAFDTQRRRGLDPTTRTTYVAA